MVHVIPRRRRARLARLRIPGLIAAVIVTAAACGGSGSSEPPTAVGTPKAGGSATFDLPGEARGLDPFSATYAVAADGNRMSALYDELVYTNPDTGSVEGQIAESLTPDASAKMWTLKLRPGVKFSDGEPFDAAAVQFNWHWHADPRSHSQQAQSAKGMQTQVVSDLELRITLPQSNANFDRLVARSLTYIAAPNAVRGGHIADHPVGAGPFVLKDGGWVKNQSLTLVRNPTYWQQGKPYLDKVVFKPVPGSNQSVKMVDSGKADLSTLVDPQAVDLATNEGLGVDKRQLSGGQMVSFSTSSGPFADPDARRAVAFALSSQVINDRFFGGKGTPAHGVFSVSSPLANPQLAEPDNDPARAAELFRKVTANGSKPLKAELIVANYPSSLAIGEYIRSELGRYPGVTVTVTTLDQAQYVQRLNYDHDYDMAINQIWMDDPEPTLYDFLRSDRGILNCCGYRNATVDAALSRARNTTDTTQRQNAYTQVQLELNQDMPVWVYQESMAATVFASRITGIQSINDGVVLMDRVGIRS